MKDENSIASLSTVGALVEFTKPFQRNTLILKMIG